VKIKRWKPMGILNFLTKYKTLCFLSHKIHSFFFFKKNFITTFLFWNLKKLLRMLKIKKFTPRVKKIKKLPGSIFSTELNIIATQTPCKGDHIPSYLNNLLLTLSQLVLNVNVTGRNGSTNARPLRVFHSLPCNANVFPNAPTYQFNQFGFSIQFFFSYLLLYLYNILIIINFYILKYIKKIFKVLI